MRERKCVGRPRSSRYLSGSDFRCMMPACRREGDIRAVTLLPEEVEALKLIDLQDLGQEEAAAVMGVSRKTIWKDIHSARKKIADAIINGKAIRIEKCESEDTETCGIDICMKKCRGSRCIDSGCADPEDPE
ncbi:DNA-binding protein [Methanocella sp. CWC-04]|uniref:UPF0251 protein CUJ83_04815 n=1 Tax=Methanooceanicella nereidis TaxID=2052831 RepID=A0AAP2RB82_9EURY|nr:DUF134 domain-containing protein [Methanocella sp. CWC-04]MCD1294319.1 DNA-binding protein [Methanocella sp. CWC-04]